MKTIIEMAREAKLLPNYEVYKDDLERFAALVRADERERAMRENAYVLAEREACAKVCEDEICNCCWDEQAGAVAEHLAATIRARGNT